MVPSRLQWLSNYYDFLLPIRISHKGSFTNYVDKILALFDHLPPCIDIFYLMIVDEYRHFWTTYPPLLVNVVCERPGSLRTYERLLIFVIISLIIRLDIFCSPGGVCKCSAIYTQYVGKEALH